MRLLNLVTFKKINPPKRIEDERVELRMIFEIFQRLYVSGRRSADEREQRQPWVVVGATLEETLPLGGGGGGGEGKG